MYENFIKIYFMSYCLSLAECFWQGWLWRWVGATCYSGRGGALTLPTYLQCSSRADIVPVTYFSVDKCFYWNAFVNDLSKCLSVKVRLCAKLVRTECVRVSEDQRPETPYDRGCFTEDVSNLHLQGV